MDSCSTVPRGTPEETFTRSDLSPETWTHWLGDIYRVVSLVQRSIVLA